MGGFHKNTCIAYNQPFKAIRMFKETYGEDLAMGGAGMEISR